MWSRASRSLSLLVARVSLTGGDKKTFEFTVHLTADPSDWLSRPSSFTITRTVAEIDRVSKIVQDAWCRHYDLSKYDVPSCQLCELFKSKMDLPVSTKDRLLKSREAIQRVMEKHVVALVTGAVVPPTNADLFCEGVTRFPAAVTKFLLSGVDQTRL